MRRKSSLSACGRSGWSRRGDLGKGPYRGERCPELVIDRGDEVVLQLVEHLQPGVRLPQLGRGRLQRARFLLELPVGLDHARCLVEDAHHLVDAERFLLDHRANEHPGGCSADHAGEQPFIEQDGLGIRLHGRRRVDSAGTCEALERGGGFLAAYEAHRQRHQIGDLCGASPDLGRLAGIDGIDEHRRARPLHGTLPCGKGHRQKSAGIDEHRPEGAMGHRIEPGEAEERIGLQQRDAERSIGDEVHAERARARKGGKQQRVAPDQEPARDTGECARLGGAAPIESADDCRRELGDGDKRHQADRDERELGAVVTHVEVAEHHDDDHGRPPDPEEKPRQVRLLGQAQPLHPKQRRHHDVVADHQAERRRLDHDHARRGGQPAEERDQGQRNGCAVASGSDRTRLSGSVSVGSIILPAMAIGRTNRLIASR